jgi:6-phosphogluconate dehydrogenase (decarboxylating)
MELGMIGLSCRFGSCNEDNFAEKALPALCDQLGDHDEKPAASKAGA